MKSIFTEKKVMGISEFYFMIEKYITGIIRKLGVRLFGTISVMRLIEFPLVLNWLEPKNDEKICDVACGNGELSFEITKTGCYVYGIDISKEAIINSAKKNSARSKNCHFIVGSAEYLPCRSGVFDKVVSNCALEHFQNDIEALKEMNRILKLNSTLILTVDSFSYPRIKSEIKKEHAKTCFVVNYYTHEKLERKLKKSGFQVISSKYYLNTFLSNIFYSVKYYKDKDRLPDLLWVFFCLFMIPLCVLSDKLFGSKDWGYGLAIKAKKSKETY